MCPALLLDSLSTTQTYEDDKRYFTFLYVCVSTHTFAHTYFWVVVVVKRLLYVVFVDNEDFVKVFSGKRILLILSV